MVDEDLSRLHFARVQEDETRFPRIISAILQGAIAQHERCGDFRWTGDMRSRAKRSRQGEMKRENRSDTAKDLPAKVRARSLYRHRQTQID